MSTGYCLSVEKIKSMKEQHAFDKKERKRLQKEDDDDPDYQPESESEGIYTTHFLTRILLFQKEG